MTLLAVIQRYPSKVVLCGSYRVGKTSLRRNFLGETFKEDHHPTLGVDFSVKSINIDIKSIVEMQIWDFSGQPGFKILRSNYLKSTSAAILVFDLTNRDSLYNLRDWADEIWSHPDNKKTHLILFGNKADLEEHQVSQKEIDDFISWLNDKNLNKDPIKYFITSAKTGLNVEESLTIIANLIRESMDLNTE